MSVDPTHAAVPLVSQTDAARATRCADHERARAIPSAYRCGDAIDRIGVPFNGVGLELERRLRSRRQHDLFFRCLPVHLHRARVVGSSPRRRICNRSGRRAFVLCVGRGSLTFCGSEGFRPNPTGVEIVSFKWVPADQLGLNSRAGFGLKTVQVMR